MAIVNRAFVRQLLRDGRPLAVSSAPSRMASRWGWKVSGSRRIIATRVLDSGADQGVRSWRLRTAGVPISGAVAVWDRAYRRGHLRNRCFNDSGDLRPGMFDTGTACRAQAGVIRGRPGKACPREEN